MANLPKSLQQPFRKNKLVVGSGWRAFFAPYNSALGSAVASTVVGPTILDLTSGPFIDTTQPIASSFYDMGWIKDFKRTPESKIGQVRSGYRGAVRAQYRGQVGENFEFKFREYGKKQYSLATGVSCFNILGASGMLGGGVGPLSASGAPSSAATAYTAGTFPWGVGGGVAPTITITTPAAAQIGVGSYIVVDVDYNTATFGLVGDAGVPVFKNAVTDVDYIRKTSDYVARVTAINGNVCTLDQPLIGGGSGNPAPGGPGAVGAKAQMVSGFSAREGGTFISEWTALLLLTTIDQAYLFAYYPHVSILANRDVAAPWAIENIGTTDLGGSELDAQFAALAFDDPLDGETVVSYQGYFYKPGESPGF
jgi:hypothetical protein